ncbi:MAG: LLM class flavin-dependent oxidoreductase [Candidatus Binatia bacterium]
MQIGVSFPYYSRSEPTRDFVLSWFRRVDAGPFSSITCGERIVGPCVEMSATLAAAAAVTQRVRIIPSLYVLPMHSAWWVAKHAATLDVLSGGRVTVTVGVGGREHDYRCMERPRTQLLSRMEEQVRTIRRTWAGEVPFEGADAVGPRPVQPAGPPIVAGVMAPHSIRRAARWADGVSSWSANGERNELAVQLDNVRAAWVEAGRDRPPRLMAGFWYSLAPDAASRLRQYVYDYLLVGGQAFAQATAEQMTLSSPDAVRGALDAYEELGVDECVLNAATADLAEIDNLADLLAKRG